MIRVGGLGVWVDVDLADNGLDEAEFRRLWGRALVEPASTASRVETAAAPPTPEPPSSEQSPGFDTTAPLASSAAAGSTNVESAAVGSTNVVVLQAGTSFESATQQLTRALIEQQWGTLLMLHAGAVADPETGRALAFVAPGGTGKSTLTRLLGQKLGYVTDETVGVVPGSLRVLPYPKPLTWADEKGKPKREHAPEDVGLGATPAEPTLAALAVLRRRDGAEASFRTLGLLEALEMVVPETSSLSKLNLPLEVFADVYEQVGGVTLIEYGEAEDVVEWCVQSLVDSGAGSAAAAPSIRSFVPHEHSGQRLRRPLARNPAGERAGNETLSERAEVLVAGEESAVLIGDELLRLGPIATAIVELLPCSVEELAAALEERFGAPADGNLIPAVEEQLRTLAEHGVVERGN